MPKVTPDKTGHLEFGDHRIWWEYFGQGDREAVCLLNGLAMHTKAWYGLIEQFQPEFDVILYDYLGQGESSCPDEPHFIPEQARYLTGIMDHLGIERIHILGISYGGFIALDFGRLFQDRLHTLTISGILLSHERHFQMYQDMSLKFYAGGPEFFELYTHYLYEKIFGEPFLRAVPPETLEEMRQRFHDRYAHRVHSLVRLTEAQNPFFGGLDERMPEYRAIATPTLLISGEQDRCLPLWQQKPILDIIPDIRWELMADAGHVAYLEQPDIFFPMYRAFIRAKATDFEIPDGDDRA